MLFPKNYWTVWWCEFDAYVKTTTAKSVRFSGLKYPTPRKKLFMIFTFYWMMRWYISKSNAFFRAKKKLKNRNKKVNHLYTKRSFLEFWITLQWTDFAGCINSVISIFTFSDGALFITSKKLLLLPQKSYSSVFETHPKIPFLFVQRKKFLKNLRKWHVTNSYSKR